MFSVEAKFAEGSILIGGITTLSELKNAFKAIEEKATTYKEVR